MDNILGNFPNSWSLEMFWENFPKIGWKFPLDFQSYILVFQKKDWYKVVVA